SSVLLKRMRSDAATFFPACASSSAPMISGRRAGRWSPITSSMMILTSQGGRSSTAAATAAAPNVSAASRQYGRMYLRTRSRDFKAGNRLDHFHRVGPPIRVELFDLGEGGE